MRTIPHSRMTEGPILPSVLLYSLPLIGGNLMQQLYNTFDSIIVGNLVGDTALAAVGAGGQILGLLITAFLGAGAGAGILIAMYYGAQEPKRLSAAVHSSIVLTVWGALFLTMVGLGGSRLFLRWMDTPAEVLPEAVSYLRIIFLGTLFRALYNMAAAILNAVGNSARSLRYLAVSSVLNIVLDLLFVGVLRWGVAGATWATVLSEAVSAALSFRYLCRVEEIYRVRLPDLRLDRSMGRRILRLGIPSAVQGTVISFSNVLIQAGVNAYGTAAMAGFTAYMKVDGFNILPVHSFSLAASTFVGQNLGAGKRVRAKSGTLTILGVSLAYTAAMSVLMLSFSRSVLSIFGGEEQAIQYGILCLRALSPFYTLLAVIHSLAGAVRGSGHTLAPMAIILFSLCLCRIAWIRLAAPLFGSIRGVFLTYPVSFFIGAALMVVYALFAHWLEIPSH